MPRSLEDVQNFMDRERLASFATVTSHGKAHVVPVFFTYDNGKIYVQTDRASAKVRNLMQNGNVAVAVYSEEEAVVVNGKARIIEDEGEFLKRTRDHIGKYRLRLDSEGRDSLGIPLFDKKVRCVVEVKAERILFW